MAPPARRTSIACLPLVIRLRPLERQHETVLAGAFEAFDGEQRMMQSRQAGLDQECGQSRRSPRTRMPVANGTSMKAGQASSGRPPLLNG